MTRSSPMNDDQFRWAEALALERIHGDRVMAFVKERLDALASAGDVSGVERITEIARRLKELRLPGRMTTLPGNQQDPTVE